MNSHKSIDDVASVSYSGRIKTYGTKVLVLVCMGLFLCNLAQAKSARQSLFKDVNGKPITSSRLIKWLKEELTDEDGNALYLDLEIVINSSQAGQFIDAAWEKGPDNKHRLPGDWHLSTATGGGNKILDDTERKERRFEAKLDAEYNTERSGWREGLKGKLAGQSSEEPFYYYGFQAQYIKHLQENSFDDGTGTKEIRTTNKKAHEAAAEWNRLPQPRRRSSEGNRTDNMSIDGRHARSRHAIIFDTFGEYPKRKVLGTTKIKKGYMHYDICASLYGVLNDAGYSHTDIDFCMGRNQAGKWTSGKEEFIDRNATARDLLAALQDLAKKLRGPNNENIGHEKAFIWIDAPGDCAYRVVEYAALGEPGTPGNGKRFHAPGESIVIEGDAAIVRCLGEEVVGPGGLYANDENLHRSGNPDLTLATSDESFAGSTEVGIYANDILVDTISFNNDPGVYTVSLSDEVLNELIPTLESDPNITIGFELPSPGDYFDLATDDDFWNDPNYPNDYFGIGIDFDLMYVPEGIVTAFDPYPDDGWSDIRPGRVELKWSAANVPGVSHNIYFGEIFDFVDNADTTTTGIFRGNQKDTHYDVSDLVPSMTYYWRVDEIAYDGTTHKGDVWSFTPEEQIPNKIIREVWLDVPGESVDDLRSDPRFPENPAFTELADWLAAPTDCGDNYGQRFLGYLKPPVTGDYAFRISSDDQSEFWLSIDDDPATLEFTASVPGWTNPLEGDKYPEQESEEVSLVAGEKYCMEVLMKEGGGGDNLAVEWKQPGGTWEILSGEYVDLFPGPLLSANTPNPANGQTDVDQELDLKWNASDNVLSHRVFFGNDFTEVTIAEPHATDPEYKGRQAGTTFDPGALEWGKTYYWRVDEEISDGTVQKGPVWNFTTADFFKVDDFEGYDDNVADGGAIFQTWTDYWAGNGTDIQIGFDFSGYGTFCETEIVHSGNQSAPIYFNMGFAGTEPYSETGRTFDPALDLTVNGMDTLTFYIYGQVDNGPTQLYVGLQSGSTRVNVSWGDPTIVQSASWTEVSIPLDDFAPVDLTAVDGLFIRLVPDAPTPGGAALIFIDDIRATKAAD